MTPLFPGLAECTDAKFRDRSHRCATCVAFARHLNAELIARRTGVASAGPAPTPPGRELADAATST